MLIDSVHNFHLEPMALKLSKFSLDLEKSMEMQIITA